MIVLGEEIGWWGEERVDSARLYTVDEWRLRHRSEERELYQLGHILEALAKVLVINRSSS